MGDEDPVSGDADETDRPCAGEADGGDVAAAGEDPVGPPGQHPAAHGRHALWAAAALAVAVVDSAVAARLAPVAGGMLPLGLYLGAAAALGGAALVVADRSRRTRRWLTAAGSATVVGLACWVGANSPTATWFGHQVGHGPRDRPTVALTFDDGPNDPATGQIASILDAAGVKGTFFVVGKAADRRPAIVRSLVDHGHLVGNHSQHHDETSWLDPGYPELDRAERAIQAAAGVCPAWFRAPHGQHTPFVAHVVSSAGMTMVGWDVSAGDWLATDPVALARKVVDRARPGSVIDLHDGLDGDVTADRSVLVRALPLILDGLAGKGLVPVRLDELLGGRAYLPTC